MILYKKRKNEFLIPMFMGVMVMLLNFVPIHNYFNAKSTNTDALPITQTFEQIEHISLPEKTELAEIEVPTLGSTSNSTANYSATSVNYASACASTPTPGYNQISVCGRVIPIYYRDEYAGVTPLDGHAVKYTKGNFIFGNNGYNVFGGLHILLRAGDPIIVNLDGVENTYYFSYYWLNDYYTANGIQDVDPGVKQVNSTNALGLMTCAPWENVNHTVGARFDFLFIK